MRKYILNVKLLPLMCLSASKSRVHCHIQCILEAPNRESTVPQRTWNIWNERHCYCHLGAKSNSSQKALRGIFRHFQAFSGLFSSTAKQDRLIHPSIAHISTKFLSASTTLWFLYVNPPSSPLLQNKVRGLVKARAWLCQRDHSWDRKIRLTVTEVQGRKFLELGIRATKFGCVVHKRTT